MPLFFARVFNFLLVTFGATLSFAHGVAEADKERMIDGGLLDYLMLGAKHMITGYDHLLFLFGVIFFLTKFKEIVLFVTAFTLGHSITLIFATFLGITANEYLVDAVIAVTVIYKGFDNIDGFKRFLKIRAPNLLVMVFIFGLIHGFGLSTRLQHLPLGNDGLLAKIISFNVGVELGQIVALAVMALLLAGWRKTPSFARFSRAANVLLMVAGFCLLAYQISLYAQYHDHYSTPEPGTEETLYDEAVGEHGHDHETESVDEHEHGHDHEHQPSGDHMHPNEEGHSH